MFHVFVPTEHEQMVTRSTDLPGFGHDPQSTLAPTVRGLLVRGGLVRMNQRLVKLA